MALKPNIEFLIGVDGGGSGTRARLFRPDGAVLAQGSGGPSSLGQGIPQAWASIREAIDSALLAAGHRGAALQSLAVGLGLAGAHVRERCDALLAAAPAFGHITFTTDSHAALLGAHSGGPGVLVVAGTGSVGEALHADGSRVAVGGWGFPVGDEAIGAWLGLRAMQVAQRALDGRIAPGALARAVWAATRSERDALLLWCSQAGQHAYAQLAPLVFDTEQADARAAQLVARLIDDIAEHVAALDPTAQLPVALYGSIGRRIQPRLPAALRARCVEPAGDAIDGAVRLLRADLHKVTA
jgi:glucosamine kinase